MIKNQQNDAIGKLIGYGVLFIIIVPALSFWTQYNLNFWLTHFKESPVHVGYFISLLLTFGLSRYIIALNTLAAILMLLI